MIKDLTARRADASALPTIHCTTAGGRHRPAHAGGAVLGGVAAGARRAEHPAVGHALRRRLEALEADPRRAGRGRSQLQFRAQRNLILTPGQVIALRKLHQATGILTSSWMAQKSIRCPSTTSRSSMSSLAADAIIRNEKTPVMNPRNRRMELTHG